MRVTGRLVDHEDDAFRDVDATIELPKVGDLQQGNFVLVKCRVSDGDDDKNIRVVACGNNFGYFTCPKSDIVYKFATTPPQDSIVVPEKLEGAFTHNKVVDCLTQMKAAIDDINKRMDEKEGK